MTIAESPNASRSASFSDVSELPGKGASPEALDMLRTRYNRAAELGAGKDLLEVACATGIGLGLMGKSCRSVTAGDYDPELVERAKTHYGDRFDIQQLDAMDLPFESGSKDVVLILEALYFVPDADRAVAEARRVLRPGGCLFIAQPNPEFSSFNPAPKTFTYFKGEEMRHLMSRHGFDVEILLGFPEDNSGIKSKVLNLVRKVAVALRLIPDTMEGKEKLKRLIYGKLPPFPAELDETIGEVQTFENWTNVIDRCKYKVMYAIATIREGTAD